MARSNDHGCDCDCELPENCVVDCAMFNHEYGALTKELFRISQLKNTLPFLKKHLEFFSVPAMHTMIGEAIELCKKKKWKLFENGIRIYLLLTYTQKVTDVLNTQPLTTFEVLLSKITKKNHDQFWSEIFREHVDYLRKDLKKIEKNKSFDKLHLIEAGGKFFELIDSALARKLQVEISNNSR